MSAKQKKERRRFQAHESARMKELNGLPLAFFWQRWLGHWIDLALAVAIWAPSEVEWRRFVLHQENIHVDWNFHEPGNIIVMLLYWGLFNYFRSEERRVGKECRY